MTIRANMQPRRKNSSGVRFHRDPQAIFDAVVDEYNSHDWGQSPPMPELVADNLATRRDLFSSLPRAIGDVQRVTILGKYLTVIHQVKRRIGYCQKMARNRDNVASWSFNADLAAAGRLYANQKGFDALKAKNLAIIDARIKELAALEDQFPDIQSANFAGVDDSMKIASTSDVDELNEIEGLMAQLGPSAAEKSASRKTK
jgi:hypothetical protein